MSSRGRRPPTTEGPSAQESGSDRAELGPELAQQRALGNLGVLAGLAPPELGRSRSSPAELAGRVATAVRIAPRDADTVARLVDLVLRSELPAERRSAIAERLQGDLQLSVRVSEAVTAAFGRDGADDRTGLLQALDRVPEGGDHDPVRAVAEVVAEHTGLGTDAARDLCEALSGWIGGWWEEEEEEDAPPGDYAAEESGL